MDIRQNESDATYQIKHYAPGRITINADTYTHSVLIRAHELMPWKPCRLSEVTLDDFAALFSNMPAILLLGTGARLQIPSQALLNPLFEKGIGVEFMDSKAACYTYTILSSENRNVAACILIE